MSPPNGSWRHFWFTVVTTSTWPCRSIGGALPRPFTRATRLGRPGSLSYRAHSTCASCSKRSISSTAMCSSPGGFVVSSRMRLRVSSTTNGRAAIGSRLADRRQLEAADDRRIEERMLIESRIGLAHPLHLGTDLVDERRLFQGVHRLVRPSMLPGAQQLPHPPNPHVLFGELESIADSRDQVQPFEARFRRVVGEQQAVADRRTPTDAAAELVQLREAEAISAFHHHHAGVGDVDADLDHSCGHQDLYLAVDEALHHAVLVFETPMDQVESQIGENVSAQPFELCGRGTRDHLLRFLDERAYHERLAAEPHLRAHQVVRARALVPRHHLSLDGRSAGRKLVDD